MTLYITGPTVSDYAEHDCTDDLTARVFVWQTAAHQYRYSHGEAQDAAINASRAFRAGRQFKLNAWTFTLTQDAA